MKIYPANFGLFRVWFAVVTWVVCLATGIGFARLSFVKIDPDTACSLENIRYVFPLDGMPSVFHQLLAIPVLLPIAMINGLWTGAFQALPALIVIALLAIACAEFPYQRSRALGIVTIPIGCALLASAGYMLAAHYLATTGCYPALLDAPRY